jgi:small subunit ribosomal protein S17
MPRKKKEELEEGANAAEANQEETTDEAAVEVSADDNAGEDKPNQESKAKEDTSAAESSEATSSVDAVIDTVSSVVGGVANIVADSISTVVAAVTGDSSATDAPKSHHSKRAEKIGIVQSDKMTKTVTVRVDRVVKHPVYRKYIKRRKKFMAHDELGATVGDKVRIMETRPLSARKRWRVVEIVQKAVK